MFNITSKKIVDAMIKETERKSHEDKEFQKEYPYISLMIRRKVFQNKLTESQVKQLKIKLEKIDLQMGISHESLYKILFEK